MLRSEKKITRSREEREDGNKAYKKQKYFYFYINEHDK